MLMFSFKMIQERLQTWDVWEMSYPFSFSWPHYGFSPRPLNFQDEPLQIKSTLGPSCSSSPPHQQLLNNFFVIMIFWWFFVPLLKSSIEQLILILLDACFIEICAVLVYSAVFQCFTFKMTALFVIVRLILIAIHSWYSWE